MFYGYGYEYGAATGVAQEQRPKLYAAAQSEGKHPLLSSSQQI